MEENFIFVIFKNDFVNLDEEKCDDKIRLCPHTTYKSISHKMDIDVRERLSLTLIFLLCLDFFLKGGGC
jgi:hypothetical protein